jgi:hypothetical protein
MNFSWAIKYFKKIFHSHRFEIAGWSMSCVLEHRGKAHIYLKCIFGGCQSDRFQYLSQGEYLRDCVGTWLMLDRSGILKYSKDGMTWITANKDFPFGVLKKYGEEI